MLHGCGCYLLLSYYSSLSLVLPRCSVHQQFLGSQEVDRPTPCECNLSFLCILFVLCVVAVMVVIAGSRHMPLVERLPADPIVMRKYSLMCSDVGVFFLSCSHCCFLSHADTPPTRNLHTATFPQSRLEEALQAVLRKQRPCHPGTITITQQGIKWVKSGMYNGAL